MTDYALWEVIVNGDSLPPKRTVNGVEKTYPHTTVEEKLAWKNELKARGTLLMALPNEHQLKFNTYKCAKTLMEAIKKRFGGNKDSKKTQKTLLKQQYDNFNRSSSKGLDQTYDRLQKLIKEMDLKWQMAMLTMRARRFLNKTGRKINANGSKTIRFNKSKVECSNCHKNGHFARECRALRENRNREPVRRNVTVETTKTKALVAQDGLGSSSSDSEVSTCSKACLKSYETLKEHYDNLTKDFNKSHINVGAYKAGLEYIEARLDVYKKNEVVFEEDIKILKLDIKLRDNALTELRKKFEKAKKERDDLKLTLKKFENSSKNLSKQLEIQVSDKFKTGMGYDSQVVYSQVFDSQVNDKHKTGEGYHAVPPPNTGNFMPPKPNLVLADEEEYAFSESITSVPAVATSEVKTIESKPKSVSEPLIEN
ncbi:ribonuclease H-like domain-containing protein [Tanacetum coccineum]